MTLSRLARRHVLACLVVLCVLPGVAQAQDARGPVVLAAASLQES
jgi:hypothetical protein